MATPAFVPAKDDLQPMCDLLLAEFPELFEDIEDGDVKIDWLFSYAPEDENGVKTRPAIMHQGYPAIGLCRVVALRDRAKGMGDVEITIDGDWWATSGLAEKRSLLAHEMRHIQLARERGGTVKYDDLNRPKIRMRKHDVQMGMFDCIAQHFGHNGIERKSARDFLSNKARYYFPELCEQGEFRLFDLHAAA